MNELRSNASVGATLVQESGDSTVTVERIQQAVHDHRSSTHALFARLRQRAEKGELTGEEFRFAAANITARTIFTLSEILKGCTEATLDLSHVRIAHSVMTAADEGGFGKPDRVHPKLMMDSINNHLIKAFGEKEIDIRPIYFAIQGRHLASELKEHMDIGKKLPDTEREKMDRLFFFNEKLARLRSLARGIHETDQDATDSIEDELQSTFAALSAFLESQDISPETVEYCDHQLRLLNNPEPGYLAGVNFAHEHLADELFAGLYAVTSADQHRYPDGSFEAVTYDYIREHGDYAARHRGESPVLKGVEEIHAERERTKLRALKPEHLPAALRGAMDFSDRNASVWDGIEKRLFGADAK